MNEEKVNVNETQDENIETENVEPEETLTKSEVDEIIKREKFKAKKEAEKTLSLKVDDLVKKKLQEEKSLSKLSADERKQKELEEREQRLQEREKEIERSILRSETISELSERKLDTRLVDFVVGEDSEKTNENIKLLASIIDEISQQAVKEFTRQSIPTESETIFNVQSNNKPKTIAEIAREKRIIK